MSESPKYLTTASIAWRHSSILKSSRTPRWSTLTSAPLDKKLSKKVPTSVTYELSTLAHVVRAFDDPAIPHVGRIDPLRDIKNVDFDLMVSDLGQIEKRLERVEKDLKKMRSADLEKEFDLLKRAKSHLESERPLREMEMTPEDKKRLRGFMFLSEKPILYVLNISESGELGKDLAEAISKYKLTEVASRPSAAAAAI